MPLQPPSWRSGARNIVTGVKMHGLEKRDGHFCLVLDNRTILAERVISTIPIARVEALCNLPASEELEAITLLTLYFSFSGERGFTEAILYNFSHAGAWKRLTVYSDFYGRHDDREYFAVEVISNHINGSEVDAEADFRRHVAANGLFRGDLRLEGSQFLENAYPIYKGRADLKAAKAIDALKAFGIEFLWPSGRLQLSADRARLDTGSRSRLAAWEIRKQPTISGELVDQHLAGSRPEGGIRGGSRLPVNVSNFRWRDYFPHHARRGSPKSGWRTRRPVRRRGPFVRARAVGMGRRIFGVFAPSAMQIPLRQGLAAHQRRPKQPNSGDPERATTMPRRLQHLPLHATACATARLAGHD